MIALVLTIIILLLLAGISINMMAGQDGILNKATKAKKEMSTAELEEKIGLAVAEWELEKGSNSSYNTTLEEYLQSKTDITSEEPLTWISGDNVVNIDSNNNLTVRSKSKNLIKNGYLENKNNDNFPNFVYNEEGYVSYKVSEDYSENTSIILQSSEYIPVDTSKKYIERVTARCNNENITINLGIIEYDIDYKSIIAPNFIYIKNTLTYLTQDLKDGDTEIYLNDLSNYEYTEGLSIYERGLIVWNYKDSTGYQYPPLTYSRNVYTDLFDYNETEPAVDKEKNVIKLKKAWSKGTIPKGTQVSQNIDTSWYNYGTNNTNLTTEWKTLSNSIKGNITNGQISFTKFRPGTKYVRFLCLISSSKGGMKNTKVDLKDIVFEEVE